MVKKFIISIFLVMLIIIGYSIKKPLKASVEVENMAKKISKIYGEQNPQIIEVKTTQVEVTNEPMYIVFLKGNFRKGELKSEKLEFSMTNNVKKVWALTSDSWQEKEIEIDFYVTD